MSQTNKTFLSRGPDTLKRVVKTDQHNTTYYFSYRAILIIPNDSHLGTSFIEEVKNDPDVVCVEIEQKEQGDNITIVADEIVFLTGAKYVYPGINLSIHCRQARLRRFLFDGGVTFDLTGHANDSVANAGPPASSDGASASFTPREYRPPMGLGDYKSYHNDATYITDLKTATRGADGNAGTDGQAGVPGGNFYFRGNLVAEDDLLSSFTGSSFTIKTKGGKGGRGGDGSGGGSGGDGYRKHLEHQIFQDFNAFATLLPIFLPGDGGNGGNGGHGGQGGQGGKIDVTCSLNGRLPTDTELKAIFETISPSGDWGENGAGGSGGPPGARTDQSGIYCMHVSDGVIVPEKLNWLTDSSTPGMSQSRALTLELDKIPKGNVGQKGQISPTPPINTALGAGEVQIMPAEEAKIAGFYKTSPYHLISLFDRLSFEFSIKYAFQKYLDPAVEREMADFKTRFAFVKSVLESSKTGVQDKFLEFQLDQAQSACDILDMRITANKDMYDMSVADVPMPKIGTFEVDRMLENYKIVEDLTGDVEIVLKQDNNARDKIQSQLASITNEVIKAVKQRDGDMSELVKKGTEIQRLDDMVKSKLVDVTVRAKDLEDAIRREIHCEPNEVLAAVSNVALFAGSESKLGFGAGSAISIGLAGYQTYQDSVNSLSTENGGHVSKDFLYTRIDNITADVTDEIRDEIKTIFNDNKEQQKEGEQARSTIRLASDKFNSMCDNYLLKIKATKDVKQAFKSLLETIESRSNLLEEYNSLFLKIANTKLGIDGYKNTLSLLNQQKGKYNDEELQLLDKLLVRANADMGKFALSALYNLSRAVNCAFLGPSSLFNAFTGLQSFSELKADALRTAFKTYFQGEDISNMDTLWKTYHSVSTTEEHPHIVVLNNENNGSVVDNFKKHNTCAFSFKLSDSSQLGFGSSWWDIRLRGFKVFLPGAKVTQPSEEQPIIGLNIEISEASYYLDQDGVEHCFLLPPLDLPFAYTYKKDPNALDGFEATTEPVKGDSFVFALEEGHQRDIPLMSPFTTFQISLDGPDRIDTTNVREISLHMDINYRGGKKQQV
ncbi:hypothetical protein N7540_004410 [Penicillium herquei]|nr:hypothetical protein N7540_004410 [Penicillium herquei]